MLWRCHVALYMDLLALRAFDTFYFGVGCGSNLPGTLEAGASIEGQALERWGGLFQTPARHFFQTHWNRPLVLRAVH